MGNEHKLNLLTGYFRKFLVHLRTMLMLIHLVSLHINDTLMQFLYYCRFSSRTRNTGFGIDNYLLRIYQLLLEQRDGVVTVSSIKDGPLVVKGNLEICAGTGHTVNRTQQAMICRCGASNNKPYCDGSHVQAGFTSDD